MVGISAGEPELPLMVAQEHLGIAASGHLELQIDSGIKRLVVNPNDQVGLHRVEMIDEKGGNHQILMGSTGKATGTNKVSRDVLSEPFVLENIPGFIRGNLKLVTIRFDFENNDGVNAQKISIIWRPA